MSSTRRILCLCSGNICRSPMAVAMLRAKLDERGVPAVVISGGTLGLEGRRADEFARRAIGEHDDEMASIIDEHRSQAASPKLIERADDILVMAPRHEAHVNRVAPEALDNVVRLWEYADDETLDQISDPVGHDAEVFRGCRDLIEECIDAWLDDWAG